MTLEGIVVNKHRLKHNFTQRDVTRLHLTLWTCNDLIFISERYRVQWTFILHVYCWTGARIAAFFTDGLRYKASSCPPPARRRGLLIICRTSSWFCSVSTVAAGDSSTRSTSGG